MTIDRNPTSRGAVPSLLSPTRRRLFALAAGLAGPSLAALAEARAASQSCKSGMFFSEARDSCVSSPVCAATDSFDETKEECVARPECKPTGPDGTQTNPACREDGSSGGCLLTSACVEELGLSDGCFELRTLRAFRDGKLAKSDHGRAMTRFYCQLAPIVLRDLPSPLRRRVLTAFYARYAVPSVVLVRLGRHEAAKRFYAAGALKLTQLFAPDHFDANRDAILAVLGRDVAPART